MNNINNIIGENIRRLRKERGLTQKELAKKCGMQYTLIGHYEQGRAHPKLATVNKIAQALRCSSNEILYGTSDSYSNWHKKPTNKAELVENFVADVNVTMNTDSFDAESYYLLTLYNQINDDARNTLLDIAIDMWLKEHNVTTVDGFTYAIRKVGHVSGNDAISDIEQTEND